jgi:hypothetical protein
MLVEGVIEYFSKGWFIAAASTFMIVEGVIQYFSKEINKLINASQKSPVEDISEKSGYCCL